MEVIDPAIHREGGSGEDEMVAVVAGQEADIRACEDVRIGTWEQAERRAPRARLVDEVLVEPLPGVGGGFEGDGEEEEVLLRADDAGPAGEVGLLEAGAVDAHVGDAERVGDADGDMDGVAGARGGLGGAGVGPVGDVPQRLEEDPGGGRGGGGGARERRGSAGRGEDLADGLCTGRVVHRARRGGRSLDWPGFGARELGALLATAERGRGEGFQSSDPRDLPIWIALICFGFATPRTLCR